MQAAFKTWVTGDAQPFDLAINQSGIHHMTAVAPRNFTVNAIHVGSRLYEILVHHAATSPGTAIRYGDLLAACRARNLEDAIVQRAVPIGIGMQLLFVQAFCDKHAYPNLACLAVNQKGMPGRSYPGNWEEDMHAVAAFDWSQAPAHLAAYVAEATARATPVRRCRVTEVEALEARWQHYILDKSRYASFDDNDRQEIINLLMECISVEDAYQSIMDAKADLGPVA